MAGRGSGVCFRRPAGPARASALRQLDFLVHQLAKVEGGRAGPGILDAYDAECRPAARTNAIQSFENLKRLGEIPQVIGPVADRAALEERLRSLTGSDRQALDRAIEHQRSHFLSDGRLPPDPRTMPA